MLWCHSLCITYWWTLLIAQPATKSTFVLEAEVLSFILILFRCICALIFLGFGQEKNGWCEYLRCFNHVTLECGGTFSAPKKKKKTQNIICGHFKKEIRAFNCGQQEYNCPSICLQSSHQTSCLDIYWRPLWFKISRYGPWIEASNQCLVSGVGTSFQRVFSH